MRTYKRTYNMSKKFEEIIFGDRDDKQRDADREEPKHEEL